MTAERPDLETSAPRAASQPERALLRLAAPAALVSVVWVVWLGRSKVFTLDEYQYAHASWLVSIGKVPYRDFFDHHFPLVYQLLAPLWWLLGDAPRNMLALRAPMLAFALLGAIGHAVTGRDEVRGTWLVAMTLMATLPTFVSRAVEVRPDPLAFALLAASLGVLYVERIPARRRGFAAGALCAGAVWASQKVFVYGAGFALALAVDGVRRRRGRTRFMLGSPTAFVAGAAAVAGVVVASVLFTGSLRITVERCILWPLAHERHMAAYPWRDQIAPVLTGQPWLLPSAALGWAWTLFRVARRRAWTHPDWLLAATVPLAFLSFQHQKVPYAYSLVPFLGFACVMAARAVTRLGTVLGARLDAGASAAVLAAVGVALPLLAAWGSRTELVELARATNAAQVATLDEIGAMTRVTDTVYDDSGAAVSRPHAHYYYFTSMFVRRTEGERLNREIPEAIRSTGAVMYVLGPRLRDTDPSLRSFLQDHFVPVTPRLCLWGQRFSPVDAAFDGTFEANIDGRYYLDPPNPPATEVVEIDGARVTTPVFELTRGAHRVHVRGAGSPVSILWLPRDEQRRAPYEGALSLATPL
jgi:hypothetical protein